VQRIFAAAIAFTVVVSVAAGSAEAVERKGFVIGFGAGGGQTRIEGESNTALGSDFHIGAMLGDKTALLLESYGVTDSEEGITVSLGVAGVAVQRWLGDKAWLKAGIGQGFAYASGDRESELKSHGFGILGAAGYELVQKTHFTLDLQGRYSTSSKDDLRINNFGVNLGFNWW